MNTTDIMVTFREFIENFKDYKARILNSVSKGDKFIEIDFHDISLFDPDLSEGILDDFSESVKALEIVIEQIDLVEEGLTVRLINLPKSLNKDIWRLRSENIGKLTSLTGYIRKISGVLHSVSSIRWECPACGGIITTIMVDNKINKPSECSCGRKGKFRIISRTIFDLQKMIIEEDPSILGNTQKPRRILAVMKNDLCQTKIDSKLQLNKKVQISGIVKELQIKPDSPEYKKYIDAHNVKFVEDAIGMMKFTQEDKKKFKEISQSETLFEDLKQSIFPTIYGNESAKLALTLQLFGGVHLFRDNELEERGTIHILLMGSPGIGKTKLMKRSLLFIPHSRFSTGKGSSAVGLISSVSKDEEMGGYVLELGVIPLCNKSIAGIDEIDKISKADLAMLNSAMIDLKIPIDKADIHQIVETDTAILAAGNPVDRVFDPNIALWKQIGLPKDSADRFDLIIPIDDMKNEEGQRKIADLIFSKYRKTKATEPIYSRTLVMKYLSYAKQKYKPVMTEDVEKHITDNFINLIKPSGAEEGAYFSSRLLTNIIRFAQASAKTRLSKVVTVNDATRAINLLIDSLKKQNIISSVGLLDVEKLEAIVPKNKRDKYNIIRDGIDEGGKENKGVATEDDVRSYCKNRGMEETDFEDSLEQLKREGDVFEPRRGLLALFGRR